MQSVMSEPPHCCICLDEFSRPASLPCGHCFCLGCIGEYWRISKACQCPLCKAFFPSRPQLKTDQALHAGALNKEGDLPLKAGEVLCDFCPVKHRAVKSCVKCLASYCAAHLEPHYRSEELGRHLLISVVKNLEDSVCRLHGKQLNRFCRSDRTCICSMCAHTEHRGHHIISISKEATKKKVESKKTTAKQHFSRNATGACLTTSMTESFTFLLAFESCLDCVKQMQKSTLVRQLIQTYFRHKFIQNKHKCIFVNYINITYSLNSLTCSH